MRKDTKKKEYRVEHPEGQIRLEKNVQRIWTAES
jgi:hypothetical protein